MKLNNTALKIIKFLIVIAAYWYITKKIIFAPDIKLIPKIISSLDISDFFFLLIIISLMIINWSIESYKWKYILPENIKISFVNSIKAVLSGITAGTITPNRIGEFGGRILFLKPEFRKKGAAYTIIGDISQFVCTMIFGVTAFAITGYKIIEQTNGNTKLSELILILGIIISILSLLIYFSPGIMLKFIKKIRFLKKHIDDIKEIQNIKKIVLINTLILSIARFLIFIFQFYLMFWLFGIEITFFNCLLGVCNLYLATTIIPNIPFGEPAIRSTFSVIFLGIYIDAIAMIVIVSLSIYLINVAFPAILGGYFLLQTKNSKLCKSDKPA
jgi:uncharacterized membrane protein YbhN (UPF0104 family)